MPIDTALRSMKKLGHFAATLQHARSVPVWSQTCVKVAFPATEAGWIDSETRRPIRRLGGVMDTATVQPVRQQA